MTRVLITDPGYSACLAFQARRSGRTCAITQLDLSMQLGNCPATPDGMYMQVHRLPHLSKFTSLKEMIKNYLVIVEVVFCKAPLCSVASAPQLAKKKGIEAANGLIGLCALTVGGSEGFSSSRAGKPLFGFSLNVTT